MNFDSRPPIPRRIATAPAGRGAKPRPQISVTPEYVRKLLEEQRVTERDEQLLRYLDETPVLSSQQIHRLLWPGSSHANMRRRMRQLYDYYMLDRVRMVSKAEGITYTMGKAGRMWIHEGEYGERSFPKINVNTLNHDLMASEVLVLLTEAVRHCEGTSDEQYRMLWLGEHNCRVIEQKRERVAVRLEPDSMFAILSDGSPVCACYLEADQATERGEAIQDKIRRYYLAAGNNKLRNVPRCNPLVVTVTPSQTRARNLAEVVAQFQRSNPAGSIDWMVTPLSALKPANFLTSAPWYVVMDGDVVERKVNLLDWQND